MVLLEQILFSTGGVLEVSPHFQGDRPKAFQKLSPLQLAQKEDISFFFSLEYQKDFLATKAGLVITGSAFIPKILQSGLPLLKDTVFLVCDEPYLAMAKVSGLFNEEARFARGRKIHSTAVIHESVLLPSEVEIGPYVVIEANARIGLGTRIDSHCWIGENVIIGENCFISSGVKFYANVEVGQHVRVHSGSVIGSDGFGFAPVKENGRMVAHQKIYHFGGVKIGNHVEIGALCTINQGTLEPTVVEDWARIDSQVHLGHNSKVFRGGVVCGGTCLAGRASIGEFAYIGGMTGITNGVHVGAGAQVGAVSIVTKDVPPGGTAVGNPQRDYQTHFKVHAKLNRLLKKTSITEPNK